MKLKIATLTLIALLAAAAGYGWYALEKAKAERNIYRNDTFALLEKVNSYEVYLADTLHAASLGEVSLRLSEYESYRAEDAGLIEALKVDNRRLAQITTAQTQTINSLKNVPVRETIVEIPVPAGEGTDGRSYRTDTLRCLDITDTWYGLHGCIGHDGMFSGTMVSRDSLLYVEHVVPKRFLGFLWKYGVKERRQEIVSRNPNTEILDAEFITIRQ
jgi:hypothetical protein